MNLETEYQKALAEVGEINPWWSDADQLYIFSHPAYPAVDYAGDTPEETIAGYQRILKEWIAERLAGNIPDFVERITSGRGGARPGAGRPKKASKMVRIYVPEDVAPWLKEDAHIEQVRKLMGP